jgi:hypothetical protein
MQLSGHWSSSILRGITILAITLVLAEMCSRVFSWVRSRKLHAPSIKFMLLWVPVNLFLLHRAFSESTLETSQIQTGAAASMTRSALYPGAMAFASHVIGATQLNSPMLPQPEKAARDQPRIYNIPSCKTPPWNFRCDFGAIGSGTVVALFGASHIMHWGIAMEDMALMYSWELRVYAKHGCDFYQGSRGTPEEDCVHWLPDTMAQLRQSPPTFLFVMGTQADATLKEIPYHEEAVPFYASMRQLGTTVVALRDNPRAKTDIPRCIASHINEDFQKKCSPPLSMYKDAVMNGVISSGIHDVFIDTKDLFCDDTSCPAVIGNVLAYRDRLHITATYMHSLVPLLERKLRIQVPSLFDGRETANNSTSAPA